MYRLGFTVAYTRIETSFVETRRFETRKTHFFGFFLIEFYVLSSLSLTLFHSLSAVDVVFVCCSKAKAKDKERWGEYKERVRRLLNTVEGERLKIRCIHAASTGRDHSAPVQTSCTCIAFVFILRSSSRSVLIHCICVQNRPFGWVGTHTHIEREREGVRTHLGHF